MANRVEAPDGSATWEELGAFFLINTWQRGRLGFTKRFWKACSRRHDGAVLLPTKVCGGWSAVRTREADFALDPPRTSEC